MILVVRDMDPPLPLGGGVRGGGVVIDPFLNVRALSPTFLTRARRAEEAADDLDDVTAALAALRAIAADSGDDDDEDVVASSSSSGDDEALFATALPRFSSFGILLLSYMIRVLVLF